MEIYSKKIIKENIFTKKRRVVDEKKDRESIIYPTVSTLSKNNMISFNNLSFVNEEGYKFTGNFSLMYKITDYIKFSYHKNYAEVLKAIIEAYLQNLFNNIRYYDKFEFNTTKIKAELNIIVDKYIDGICIVDISDLNVENHYNMVFDEDKFKKTDSFYEEKEISPEVLNNYTNTGKFVISTEFVTNYNHSSRTNVKTLDENNKYISSDEFGVFGKRGIVTSGYHFMSIPQRNRISYNDNIFLTSTMILNKNNLKNGVCDYIIEGKIIYQITDPSKYIDASASYKINDFLNKSFYNFLINYDRIYGIKNIKPILNQDEVLTLFKFGNEEYILTLEEYGIKVDAICIVGKERVENIKSLVRK